MHDENAVIESGFDSVHRGFGSAVATASLVEEARDGLKQWLPREGGDLRPIEGGGRDGTEAEGCWRLWV